MNTRNMILICKALSDTKRLEIVQILSDGENVDVKFWINLISRSLLCHIT